MSRTSPHLRLRLARTVTLVGVLLVLAAGIAQASSGASVVQLTATGVVDGAMAGYLREGIAAAAADGADAVVVQLDTPGGSITAMNEIKQAFLEAPLPVIVWVAPSGARAASAGTFITLAAHLAYMAPATNIGAAAPVSSTGGDIPGTMGVKVREDAIASIRALAEAQGRPVDWAVSTVEDARSYSASEALEAGAVDGIAATIEEVLADADGRQVEVFGTGTVTLDVDGAAVTDAPMNPVLSFLHLLSDPNIAFILFVAGALLLATELVSTNLVTGDPGRAGPGARLHRLREPPAQRRGPAAGGLRVRPVRPGVADRQPWAPDRRRGSCASCSAPRCCTPARCRPATRWCRSRRSSSSSLPVRWVSSWD